MDQTNALALYNRMDSPVAAMEAMGEVFYKSGMFAIDRPEQGRVLALACLSEGMSPFQLLRTYHIIQGRLTKRSDKMLAEFKAMGGKCRWIGDINDTSKQRAQFVLNENDLEAEYNIEDAKREGLTGKDVWKKSAPDMMRARLISKVMRMIAPEIVAGIYAPEETPAYIDTTATVETVKEPLLPETPKAATATVVEPVKPTKANRPERLNNRPTQQAAPPAEKPAEKPVDKPAEKIIEIPAEKIEENPHDAKLCELIPEGSEIEGKVNKFLRGNNYIQADETFLNAAKEVKESIVTKFESFSNAVNAYCDANK